MVCWKKQSAFLYYNCVHSDKVEVTVKDGFIGNADKIFQANQVTIHQAIGPSGLIGQNHCLFLMTTLFNVTLLSAASLHLLLFV